MQANPNVLAGREMSGPHREQMDESDFAGQHRSFPIETPEDVHDAARSIGRAGGDNYDPATLKRNIIRIARRKGAPFVARLPEEWKKDLEAGACAGTGPLALLIGDSRAAADGTRRFPVALATRGYKGSQRYEVTRQDLADIVLNLRKKQANVPVDYEHSTLHAGDGNPAPTAGWLKRIEDSPDAAGVLWGWVEYTEQGARSVAARDYKYASPVIEWGLRDKITGEPQGATLTSSALTKRPLFENLPELPLLAASDGWSFDRGDVAERREKNVKIVKVKAAAAGRVRLVADDSTETEMEIDGLRVLTLNDVRRDDKGKLDFAPLEEQLRLTGDTTLVAAEVWRAQQAERELDAAVAAGKILPSQRASYAKLAASDLAEFRKLAASMTPAVNLRIAGTGLTGEGPAHEGFDSAGARLSALVRQKLAASEMVGEKGRPKLDYGEALWIVLRDHPQLEREWKTEMGR